MSIIRLGGVISSSRLPSADPAKWIDASRVARIDDVYRHKHGAQEVDPMSASVPRAGTVTPIEPVEGAPRSHRCRRATG